MSDAPRLLDLFCCEGGAGMGYHRAGYRVYGVDIIAQRRYPFAFHLGDALVVLRWLLLGEAVPFTHRDGTVEWLTLADFAAIHASPPCQAYSVIRHTHGNEHPELIAPTRELLIETGLPYIIENVEGALPEMREPVLLCGSMFALKAIDIDGIRLALRRHRLFESNVFLMSAGGCAHDSDMVGGVYGHGRSDRRTKPQAGRGGYSPSKPVREALMGMDWATQHGLSQAIPPAYTEFLGHQLMASLAMAHHSDEP